MVLFLNRIFSMELSFTTIRNYLPSLPPIPAEAKKMHHTMHRYISDLSSASKTVYTSVFILTLGCCLTGIVWYIWKRCMANPASPPPPPPLLPLRDVELKPTEDDKVLLKELSTTGPSLELDLLTLATTMTATAEEKQIDPFFDRFFALYQEQPGSNDPANLQKLFDLKIDIIDCLLRRFHGERVKVEPRRARSEKIFMQHFKTLPITVEANQQFAQCVGILQEAPNDKPLAPFLSKIKRLSPAGFIEELRQLIPLCSPEHLPKLTELTREVLLFHGTHIQNIHDFAVCLKATDEALEVLAAAGLTELCGVSTQLKAEAIAKLLSTPLILNFEEFRPLNHSIRFLKLNDRHEIMAWALSATLQNLPTIEERTALLQQLRTLSLVAAPILAKSSINLLKAFHDQYLANKIEGAAPFHLPDFRLCLNTVRITLPLPSDLSLNDQEEARKVFDQLTELSNSHKYFLPDLTAMKNDFDAVKRLLDSQMDLLIDNATEDDEAIARRNQGEEKRKQEEADHRLALLIHNGIA